MRIKNLLAVSAIALLAACSTAEKDSTEVTDDMMATQGSEMSGSPLSGFDSQFVDSQGLDPNLTGTQQDLVVHVGDRVFFAYDRSDLSQEARATLDRQAAFLMRFPHLNVIVEGHCDERGTREYNLALGERRANSARDYLVALGISSNRIRTVSYGKERPAVLGANPASWAQNRRGVTVIQ